MMKKALIWIVALAALAALGSAAYYYRGTGRDGREDSLPPAVTPDTSVIAGPVLAVSPTSITILKQDGTSATLGIAQDTRIVAAGDNGQPGARKKAGDIRTGMMVLATPSASDASVAMSLVLLPVPPAR